MPRSIRLVFLMVVLLLIPSFAWAAPDPAVLGVRYHQSGEGMRIVLDMNALPDYAVMETDQPLRLTVELNGTVSKARLSQLAFTHPHATGLMLQATGKGLNAVIDLRQPMGHKVFTLQNPSRLVIDLFPFAEQKVIRQVLPGITYTSRLQGRPEGPVWTHVLEIEPAAGYALLPVLSNNKVQGLETVSDMARSAQAVAAVNGSFFAANGEIIGLMKLNKELISTPGPARTALGILPDGTLIFDQVSYEGYVELPGGVRAAVSGVNRQRGDDELMIYTPSYHASTGTNEFGREYTIENDRVTAVGSGNSSLPNGAVVISAHGKAVQALSSLKVGDSVRISHSLGDQYDRAVHVVGGGPMLVRDGSVFLTTKLEEFGTDVAGGRAPRTACGVTKEGRIILAVVDGRQTYSMGMTLLELALFMQDMGSVTAMNLDGGGSSVMVIADNAVNKPSGGSERKVANALAVVPARLANSHK